MVAGVLIPGLVVGALIVIPYFNINIEGRNIWAKPSQRRWVMAAVPAFAITIFLLFAIPQLSHGDSALPLVDRLLDLFVPIVPTVIVGGALLLSSRYSPESSRPFQRWLVAKPLSFWIMTWFLVELIMLTAIGTFFRGPGWSWVLPWRG